MLAPAEGTTEAGTWKTAACICSTTLAGAAALIPGSAITLASAFLMSPIPWIRRTLTQARNLQTCHLTRADHHGGTAIRITTLRKRTGGRQRRKRFAIRQEAARNAVETLTKSGCGY